MWNGVMHVAGDIHPPDTYVCIVPLSYASFYSILYFSLWSNQQTLTINTIEHSDSSVLGHSSHDLVVKFNLDRKPQSMAIACRLK